MKSILFRSIGVSLFLLCLTLSGFADGEMGAGSRTGGGLAPDTTIQVNPKTDDAVNTSETDFFGWLTRFFTDVLS